MQFTGPLWYWRGPAPWYFVTVPAEHSVDLRAAAALVTYGWGMIPVRVTIGATVYTTSLFPREDLYVVPVKAGVRAAERLHEGDNVTLTLELRR
ncbi:DUF1905 domain-containing protein [Deinococcus maricopensis]|uniref:DUF1905 domain-containing protein n=1 Tax=Deinococcus maricopensis (strain DSM 21211 / LMG 22137 / NRRL B-23946 / LB-34) TaxID=709986 RepID=E8U9P5_DEIML|nr:DUF1905 domain-containing protein [Deinococcus maricopensis]ADV67784.1 Domain of unknown function DUF1905 [Deinococcus maricopensis DSM 21211]